MKFIQLVVFFAAAALCSSQSNDHVAYRPGQCLEGDFHRDLPCAQPEGAGYQQCFQFSDSVCCQPEVTQQLARATNLNIDGFHYTRCGPLTDQCEDYYIRQECFYRCSPNLAHWELAIPSSFAGLPVCREFCNEWFDACADDMTCAENWVTDWNFTAEGNFCMENSTCRTIRETYGNAEGLCNTLWGSAYRYVDQSVTDPDRQCLAIWWPLVEENPNNVALRNIFGEDVVESVTAAPCGVEPSDGANRLQACLSVAIVMITAALGMN